MAEIDFLTFADRCKAEQDRSARIYQDLGLESAPNDWLPIAERHARLLAQIQGWANEGPTDHPLYRLVDSQMPDAVRAIASCKAHIRRLLEQP